MNKIRFEIRPEQGHWCITALEGKLQDKVVAYADGVGLSDVDLVSNRIQGEITALWGAQIAEDTFDDPMTILSLSLNHPFGCRARRKIILSDGRYVWYETGDAVKHVASLNAFLRSIAGQL